VSERIEFHVPARIILELSPAELAAFQEDISTYGGRTWRDPDPEEDQVVVSMPAYTMPDGVFVVYERAVEAARGR
jgi:hypothetical protein